MSVPGMNLLNMAASVISLQPVDYYKNTGKITRPDGIDVPAYAAAVIVKGSVQAVPRSKYEYMGLDFAKNYVNFYTSSCVLDLQRDVNGDQFSFGGKRFQVETNTAWAAMDGWTCALCSEIPNC